MCFGAYVGTNKTISDNLFVQVVNTGKDLHFHYVRSFGNLFWLPCTCALFIEHFETQLKCISNKRSVGTWEPKHHPQGVSITKKKKKRKGLA
jgi:hypothetical protein